MCRINPRVDFAFKKLFGVEENKELLVDFINSIVSAEDKVSELTLLNPYNEKNFRNDKLSILDIKAKNINGKIYNIEMQITDQEYYNKRALYYWSRLYSSQLSSGINYDNLEKTIGINILNFNCLDEEKYHNIYKLRNTKTNNEFIDDMEIHFIELEKYDEKISTMLDRWVNFLKKADVYNKNILPKELEEVPTIKKAIDLLNNMNFTDDERESYEARLKWLRDEEMALKTAEKKGMEKEKIKIAKNLLDVLDVNVISQKTGLSIEEIEKLKLINV
ncbi:MAG: transposase [Fusobacteriia bacterium 4572_132]|nr:MAG: transposase [Fusobacteriia bacterium 4572_132]